MSQTVKPETGDPSAFHGHRAAAFARLLAIAMIPPLLGSCGTMNTTTILYAGARYYPPVDPAGVQVLRTPPTQPHQRLGEITVDASTDRPPDVQKIEARLRQEAAAIGSDAVIVVFDRVNPGGMQVTGGYWNRSASSISGHVLIGVAIKYRSRS